MRDLLRRFMTAARAADHLQPLLLLAARLYVASVFFRSGMLKLADWNNTLALFHDVYHAPLLPPDVAAVAGTFGELVFPVLVVLGLAGRLGAAGLFVVNAMAVVSYPDLFGFECPAALQSHAFWGATLLALIAFGPGRFSLDAMILGRMGLAPGGASRPGVGMAV